MQEGVHAGRTQEQGDDLNRCTNNLVDSDGIWRLGSGQHDHSEFKHLYRYQVFLDSGLLNEMYIRTKGCTGLFMQAWHKME